MGGERSSFASFLTRKEEWGEEIAIKIITLPFDEKNGSFDEKAVNYFIENKIVKSIKTDIVN